MFLFEVVKVIKTIELETHIHDNFIYLGLDKLGKGWSSRFFR